MRRALLPLLAGLLALAGSLGATVSLHRAARAALDRVLEERLRGAGATAALTLWGGPAPAGRLAALMAANSLDGAYLLDRSLTVLADAAGPAGGRVDLLRVDAARVERAFAGEASVAPAWAIGEVEVAAGYFPVRGPGGAVEAVLALEAGRAFAAARAGLSRALAVGVALSLASALVLALLAARWARGERLRSEATAGAARGEAVSRMAAVAAHEIRTPLGVIRGTVELMRERAAAALGERDRAALADVLAEVERLRQLTEDLLDLAADRPLALAPADLGEVLAEAVQAFGAAYPGVAVTLQAAALPRVNADRGRLRQVVANLLANAAQAGARAVEVRAAAAGGAVLVAVRDDGPGIPPEVRQRLFEPFVTGRAGGTGLGLAIARRLAERHGGALRLLAGEGRGAAFEVRLPALPGEDRAMARILVVDDEPKLGALVAEMLAGDGHAVTRAAGGREALGRLGPGRFEVVLTDLRMPEVDGLEVLRAARAQSPAPEVVVMTAYGTAQSAVEAMKAGAADYLVKPFAMDELRLRVRRLAAQRAAEERGERLRQRLVPDLVAESPRMQSALAAARQVAGTDATVLLLGESGTGKSRLASLVHYQSQRAAGPLVEVHCAALPETLLEGELFGHEKGAFTGAQQRRAGHLAAADGGTLFLDEIGEITPATQVKLLRFLQDRSFVPLGATATRTVDVRVVAATNRDLAAAVKAGAFREDLYYRLDVFAIQVPPLRERREDVLPLAERFLAARGLPPSRLSDGARRRLLERSWPGNVRELENALERALILCGEEPIGEQHLAAPGGSARGARAGDVLGEGFDLDAFERELLYAALERAGGNKAAAARLLGITRRRLYSRLASLDQPEGDPA